jgi:hypothetical protein
VTAARLVTHESVNSLDGLFLTFDHQPVAGNIHDSNRVRF